MWRYEKDKGYLLTLSHLPLVIGVIQRLEILSPGVQPDTEGHVMLGDALLYDSVLGRAAWRGIQEQLFTGVSAPVLRVGSEPWLFDVGLSEQPLCQNAKILRAWDWRQELEAMVEKIEAKERASA